MRGVACSHRHIHRHRHIRHMRHRHRHIRHKRIGLAKERGFCLWQRLHSVIYHAPVGHYVSCIESGGAKSAFFIYPAAGRNTPVKPLSYPRGTHLTQIPRWRRQCHGERGRDTKIERAQIASLVSPCAESLRTQNFFFTNSELSDGTRGLAFPPVLSFPSDLYTITALVEPSSGTKR